MDPYVKENWRDIGVASLRLRIQRARPTKRELDSRWWNVGEEEYRYVGRVGAVICVPTVVWLTITGSYELSLIQFWGRFLQVNIWYGRRRARRRPNGLPGCSWGFFLEKFRGSDVT